MAERTTKRPLSNNSQSPVFQLSNNNNNTQVKNKELYSALLQRSESKLLWQKILHNVPPETYGNLCRTSSEISNQCEVGFPVEKYCLCMIIQSGSSSRSYLGIGYTSVVPNNFKHIHGHNEMPVLRVRLINSCCYFINKVNKFTYIYVNLLSEFRYNLLYANPYNVFIEGFVDMYASLDYALAMKANNIDYATASGFKLLTNEKRSLDDNDNQYVTIQPKDITDEMEIESERLPVTQKSQIATIQQIVRNNNHPPHDPEEKEDLDETVIVEENQLEEIYEIYYDDAQVIDKLFSNQRAQFITNSNRKNLNLTKGYDDRDNNYETERLAIYVPSPQNKDTFVLHRMMANLIFNDDVNEDDDHKEVLFADLFVKIILKCIGATKKSVRDISIFITNEYPPNYAEVIANRIHIPSILNASPYVPVLNNLHALFQVTTDKIMQQGIQITTMGIPFLFDYIDDLLTIKSKYLPLYNTDNDTFGVGSTNNTTKTVIRKLIVHDYRVLPSAEIKINSPLYSIELNIDYVARIRCEDTLLENLIPFVALISSNTNVIITGTTPIKCLRMPTMQLFNDTSKIGASNCIEIMPPNHIHFTVPVQIHLGGDDYTYDKHKNRAKFEISAESNGFMFFKRFNECPQGITIDNLIIRIANDNYSHKNEFTLRDKARVIVKDHLELRNKNNITLKNPVVIDFEDAPLGLGGPSSTLQFYMENELRNQQWYIPSWIGLNTKIYLDRGNEGREHIKIILQYLMNMSKQLIKHYFSDILQSKLKYDLKYDDEIIHKAPAYKKIHFNQASFLSFMVMKEFPAYIEKIQRHLSYTETLSHIALATMEIIGVKPELLAAYRHQPQIKHLLNHAFINTNNNSYFILTAGISSPVIYSIQSGSISPDNYVLREWNKYKKLIEPASEWDNYDEFEKLSKTVYWINNGFYLDVNKRMIKH